MNILLRSLYNRYKDEGKHSEDKFEALIADMLTKY